MMFVSPNSPKFSPAKILHYSVLWIRGAVYSYHDDIVLSLARIEELEEELKTEKAKSDVLLEQQRLVMMLLYDGVMLLCVLYL